MIRGRESKQEFINASEFVIILYLKSESKISVASSERQFLVDTIIVYWFSNCARPILSPLCKSLLEMQIPGPPLQAHKIRNSGVGPINLF